MFTDRHITKQHEEGTLMIQAKVKKTGCSNTN
jgi:hypothetical protein